MPAARLRAVILRRFCIFLLGVWDPDRGPERRVAIAEDRVRW
jgi:hypothetical protein